MRSARRVVLLAGPSGSGKSPLARASGLPVITLDDFYRDGDDPALPRHSEPGIVDWDHPDAWDAARAIETLVAICADGTANIPVRRLLRDLVERRKPPLSLLRRGLALWQAERSVLRRQVACGCRPIGASEVRRALAALAGEPPQPA